MIYERMRVRQLASLDPRESVDVEVRARAPLRDRQRVAGNAGAEGDGLARVGPVALHGNGRRPDMECRLTVALDPHMTNPRIGRDRDLGDRVHAAAAIVQRDVVLHERDLAAALGTYEHPRVGDGTRRRADEQAVHQTAVAVTWHLHNGAVLHRSGVHRREDVLIEVRQLPQPGVDGDGFGTRHRRQGGNPRG